MYWAARSTLVHRPEDLAVFDRAFAVFWDHAKANAFLEEDPETIKITLATDDDRRGPTTTTRPASRTTTPR